VLLLIAAAAVSMLVAGGVLLMGGGANLFGFLIEQTGRGLQIEAVAATPFLWLAVFGGAHIAYSQQILTFQIEAPGADTVSAVLMPLLVLVFACLLALAAWQVKRGASALRLLPQSGVAAVSGVVDRPDNRVDRVGSAGGSGASGVGFGAMRSDIRGLPGALRRGAHRAGAGNSCVDRAECRVGSAASGVRSRDVAGEGGSQIARVVASIHPV